LQHGPSLSHRPSTPRSEAGARGFNRSAKRKLFDGNAKRYSMLVGSAVFLLLLRITDSLPDLSKRLPVSPSLFLRMIHEPTCYSEIVQSILYTRLAASMPKNRIQAAMMAADTTPKMTWVMIPLCTSASFRAYLATVLT
jgi:hypothetical protein